MSFIEEYEKLSTGEKNQFRETCNNLLYQCFITKLRYDRQTTTDKINNDYSFIERHYSLFEDFLTYMDIDINKDDTVGIIFCQSLANKNHLKLDSSTTLIVYALRSYYEKKLLETPNIQKVYLSSSSFKTYLRDIGLSTATKKITNQQLATSLRLLSNYNIVMRYEHNFYDNYFTFYILPPIKYVINSEKMNTLYNKITNQDDTSESNDSQESFDSLEDTFNF